MLHFDARAAKLLKPGDHLTWPQAPGLRLVASTSRRAWTYRYKSPVDSSMRQVKLGDWPAMSAGQAWVAWEALRAQRDGGADPAQAKRAARQAERAAVARPGALQLPARPTVRQMATAYADGVAAQRRKAKSLAELRRLIRVMLGPTGDLVAADVTRTQAYDLISRWQHTPVQAAMLRTELGTVWDWALDSGRLPDAVPNWWRLIMRGKLASRGKIVAGQHQGVVKRVLSAAEVGAVLRELHYVTPLVRDLLTLYLWTGCRGSEICAMEGVEVAQEVDGWWWTVPKAKLKTARHALASDLRVPLIGRALQVVQARRQLYGAGWLFPARQPNAEQPHVEQKVVGVAVWTRRASCASRPEHARMRWSIPDWSPHDLRRTVRTQLAALGCPSEVAEAVLGHLQPDIEGVYNRHHYDQERRHWLQRLDAAWEAAAGRPAA